MSTKSRLAQLSHDALLHAARLPSLDQGVIAAALYRFNTVALPDDVDGGRTLERVWHSRSAAPLRSRGVLQSRPGWISVMPRDRVTVPNYKLYVSPHPCDFDVTVETLVVALNDLPDVGFKVGRGPIGVGRPDKIVTYFATWAELTAMARHLEARLAVRAQGVPFSAQLDGIGMLSWGCDGAFRTVEHGGRASFRADLCSLLAFALLQCAGTVEQRVDSAYRTAEDSGIDTSTWTFRESIA